MSRVKVKIYSFFIDDNSLLNNQKASCMIIKLPESHKIFGKNNAP